MIENLKVLAEASVNESQLPSIISNKFNSITELENHVQQAVTQAANAKEKAQNAKISAGLFKKKEAIQLLQDATQGLAEAQISVVDAQKLLFEYQTKLTEITKFLFGLGLSNIAMNRSVVRELELRLKGASEEDISDLAKQELKNVILQLKSQEDIMKKQEFLTGKVKEYVGQIKDLGKRLDDNEEVDNEQNEKIAENARNLARHTKVLSAQQHKDEEHDKRFQAKDFKDKSQDQKIIENTEKIKSFETSIKQQGQLQKGQFRAVDKRLSDISQNFSEELTELKNKIANRNMEVDSRIKELSKRISTLNAKTRKKAWKIIISIVAAVSLLLNILQIIDII